MAKGMVTFLILSLIVIGQFSMDVYLPSMPTIATAFGVGNSPVQMTLSVFVLGLGVSQLFYGSLSDRYGRRPPLLLGLALYTLTGVGCYFASSIEQLIVLRFMQGIGAGACSALSRTIMRDVFTDEVSLSKIMAYFTMAWAVIPILAPVVGGYIQKHFDWRYNFLILFVLGLVMLVFVVFTFRETKPAGTPVSVWKGFYEVFKNRLFSGYLVCLMAYQIIIMVFVIVAPFYFCGIHCIPPDGLGWMLFLVAGGYLLGSLLNRFVAGRMGPRRVIDGGNILGLLFCVALLLTLPKLGLSGLVGFIFALNFAMGLVYPSYATLSLLPFSTLAGTANALLGAGLYLASTIGCVLGTFLPHTTLAPVVWIATGGIAFIVFFTLYVNATADP